MREAQRPLTRGRPTRQTVSDQAVREHAERMRARQHMAAASQRLQAVAQEVPGSYASARVQQAQMSRDLGVRLNADHAPTDWSQRGSIARTDSDNVEDTVRRPAFNVPEPLHRAHPTTVFSHDNANSQLTLDQLRAIASSSSLPASYNVRGMAYDERRLQLAALRRRGRGAKGRRSADRRDALRLHLLGYKKQRPWRRMAKLRRDAIRGALLESLRADTIVRDGRSRVRVALTRQHRLDALATFDNSFQ